ncbi:MAG: hypothetical protein IVW55_00565 [Chloroflexi bacterium]|nr:hypothetical protein [Chloroflexota bacterium]
MSAGSSIRDEIERSTEGLPLLGYTVQWSLRGLQVEHDDLVKALTEIGFQGYTPDPPTPRKALRRAIESWVLRRAQAGQGAGLSGRDVEGDEEGEVRGEGEEGGTGTHTSGQRRQVLVRTINRRDSEYLVFALVLEEADLRSLGLSYGTDLRVLLRKSDLSIAITTTPRGRVSGDTTPPIAAGLPEYWARYRSLHTASDLSRVVCDIVRGMGAISLRAGGGTYFVPPSAVGSLDRLRTLVSNLEDLNFKRRGGSRARKAREAQGARESNSFLLSLGVPDAKFARRSLARAAHTSFMDELAVMQTDLQRFIVAPAGTVKPKTVSERLLQYKEIYARAEMYATLLDMQKDQITSAVHRLEAQAQAIVMAVSAPDPSEVESNEGSPGSEESTAKDAPTPRHAGQYKRP